ncbi:DUF3137 domain-containing protein [Spiroplasma alleghenense]|uniref:DUF3137 domain-containing protein n=1 Tax=Spiroplasma alleghenense TaxID=216931 RepID=A0A345Z5A9_9MOLU|nr:DUF3137 domain-containing protein [Spiroplasma alleghenense]AXK51788.1 hypothetical protein SALLE_v1c11180 [Spiroplasma alleghenense]
MKPNYEELRKTLSEDLKNIFIGENKKIKKPKFWLANIGAILLAPSFGILGAAAIFAIQGDFSEFFLEPAYLYIPALTFILGLGIVIFYIIKWPIFVKKMRNLIPLDRYYLMALNAKTNEKILSCSIDKEKYPSAYRLRNCLGVEKINNIWKSGLFLNIETEKHKISFGFEFYVDMGKMKGRHYLNYLQVTSTENFVENDLIFYTKKHNYSDASLSEINLESKEFNDEFNLYGLDQIEARKIMNPKVMKKILDYFKNSEQALPLLVVFKKTDIYMRLKTFKSEHSELIKMADFKFSNNLTQLESNIFDKVISEVEDLNSVLDFLRISDFI